MRLFESYSGSSGEENLQLFRSAEVSSTRDDHGSVVRQSGSPPEGEHGTGPPGGSSTARRLKATSLAVLSGLAFTYCALTAHLLRRLTPSEVLLFRTGVQGLLIAPLAAWRLRSMAQGPPIPWPGVLAQGALMAISLQLLFVAFQRLPLGDASALIFSAPAHVSVLAWAILGERPNAIKGLAILGIVVGGVLVCQRSSDQPAEGPDAVGLACAVVGTFGYSLHYVLVRRLRGVHFSLTTLSLSAQTFALSGAILLLSGSFQIPRGGLECGLLSTVGVAGAAAHALLAIALGMEEAAVIAAARSIDIAVAYAVQVSVCREPLTPGGIGGALLISCCVFFIALEPYLGPRLCQCLLDLKKVIRRPYSL
ncbi:solute carrier family 35 member G1-like [Hetaerina americana]|uniref:solute carrier family 35 member G1-like n=1 Tax=Hetaerina americana TaxID=62018 RepID=UPI003A7F33F9